MTPFLLRTDVFLPHNTNVFQWRYVLKVKLTTSCQVWRTYHIMVVWFIYSNSYLLHCIIYILLHTWINNLGAIICWIMGITTGGWCLHIEFCQGKVKYRVKKIWSLSWSKKIINLLNITLFTLIITLNSVIIYLCQLFGNLSLTSAKKWRKHVAHEQRYLTTT